MNIRLTRAYQDATSKLSKRRQSICHALTMIPNLAESLNARRDEYEKLEGEERNRFDAQTLVATARQLEYVMTQVYEEPMPELRLANGDVIDINTEVPEGANQFVWYAMTGTAIAEFTAAWASGGMPMATLQQVSVTGKTQQVEGGYAYTIDDLRAANYAQIPLEAGLGRMVRWAHAKKLNDTAMWGREDIDLPGLLTHPNITIYDAPLNAGSTSRHWINKTADEILRDIAVLAQTSNRISFRKRKATNIWLPQAELDLISSMRLGTFDSTTVLEFAEKVHKGIAFDVLDELAASNSGGRFSTDSALALVKNKETLSLVVSIQFLQHPPQQQDLKVKVPCESKIGGVIAKEPPTIVRMDQIGAN